MGVLDTTYTFTATDVVTSAKLNNVIDQTTFTSSAIATGNNTLAVTTSGQLKVNSSGITANELGDNSVITAKILNGNVTQAKIGANVVGNGAFVRVVGSTTPFPAGGNTGTVIAFTTVQSDFYSNWNIATNTFTCPISGIYLVTCRVNMANAPVSGLTPLILINGNSQIIASDVIANTYSSGITDTFGLNAGDTIKGGVYAGQSGTIAVASLSICLIRSA